MRILLSLRGLYENLQSLRGCMRILLSLRGLYENVTKFEGVV